ncbi:MAG: hypothetical protein ACRD59_18960 [Candidatus Acidiferrales bacterium]
MRLRIAVRAGAALVAVLAFCFAAGYPASAQSQAQGNAPAAAVPARSAGSPPRYFNFVHERLKPGRESAYDRTLAAIRNSYQEFDIPAYWLELRSLTGPDEMAALNFFESFGEMEETVRGMGEGIAAHPGLMPRQDALLEENVSSVTNLIAERVDALSSRASTINLAKMRLLHVTVFHVLPGHENEFAEAATDIARAYEKVDGSPAWVMYAVNAGAPAPAYIMMTALASLKDEDAAAARRAPAMEAAGAAVQQRLREIASSAYASIETNIYFVSPLLSNMPEEFTNLDPDYWTPKPNPPVKNSH